MPDLLPYSPGPARGDSNPYGVKLIMHDLEAVAHEVVKVEILGYLEAFIGKIEHLDPVQDEHPHFSRNLSRSEKIKPHLFLRNGVF